MFRQVWVVFAVCLCFGLLLVDARKIPLSNDTSPAFVATITSKGFTNILDTFIPVLNNAIQTLDIPDIHIDTHVPEPIGHITLDLTNITISQFELQDYAVVTAPPSSLGLNINTIALYVKLNYKWRRVHDPHTSDHGSVSASPKSGGLKLAMDITVANDRPTVQVTSSVCDFQDFDIHFSGKIDWLYNLFTGIFADQITKAVNDAVSKEMEEVVDDDLNGYLASLPTTETFGGGKSKVNVDLSTTGIPIAADSFSVANALAISNNMTGGLCPHDPVTLPYVDSSDAPIELILADTAIQCAIWVSYVNGAVDFVVPSNSTQWNPYIPEISELYPDTEIDMLMVANVEPSFTMSADNGANIKIVFNVSLQAMNGTEGGIYLAMLELSVSAAVDLSVNTTDDVSSITGSCGTMNLDIAVLNSAIGQISVTKLETLAKLIGPGVKLILNKILGKGFVIPTGSGVSIVDPVLAIRDGYLVVGCDIGYNPTVKY